MPGDLLLLSEGDRLSADARLISGAVEVDMSPLTGESQPVTRSAAPAASPRRRRWRPRTWCSPAACAPAGEAEAVVFATGMRTQLGRIAALSQRVQAEVSPLQPR